MESIAVLVILLALGAVALFVEAFVPSGGLITIVGIASVVGAVALGFLKHDPTTGVIVLIIAILLVPTTLIVAFTLLPKTRFGRRAMLESHQSQETGYVAQDLRETELIGQTGVAISNLRPSGEARIGDHRYDVITEGEMIERGGTIEVLRVDGNRIVVRELKTAEKKS